MSEEVVVDIKQTLELDMTNQARVADINRRQEKRIWRLLKELAVKDAKENSHRGALIVLGEFVRFDYKIPGMRQIGENPLSGAALYLSDKEIQEKFEPLLDLDGAIVVDATGQVMAAKVYLQVDHADAAVEEECSARHITAASFSMNQHIVSCFTMSEQTGKVRMYQDGAQTKVFDPHIVEEDVDADDEQTP